MFCIRIVDRHIKILSCPVVSSEFHFDIGKAVKSPPQDEVRFQKYDVFTVLSHHL
jgi:hypothetical protein